MEIFIAYPEDRYSASDYVIKCNQYNFILKYIKVFIKVITSYGLDSLTSIKILFPINKNYELTKYWYNKIEKKRIEYKKYYIENKEKIDKEREIHNKTISEAMKYFYGGREK